MELETSCQITSENLQKQQFDAIITVSGCDSRSTYLVDKLDTSKIPFRIALVSNESIDNQYKTYNNKKFNELGFTFYNVSAGEGRSLSQVLDHICQKIRKDTLELLIDYSCMCETWFNFILNYFAELEEEYVQVNLWFSYSPAEFIKSTSGNLDNDVNTIVPALSWKKPVTLILGLGYETTYSHDVAQKMKAQETFAFYADPAYDGRYVKEVLLNNQALIKNIDNNKIIKYPIYDLDFINASLTELCITKRLTHQLILAPIGPKPFTLMCFVLATRYPDIKIWNVVTKVNKTITDRKPYGDLLLYQVKFTSEEVDY